MEPRLRPALSVFPFVAIAMAAAALSSCTKNDRFPERKDYRADLSASSGSVDESAMRAEPIPASDDESLMALAQGVLDPDRLKSPAYRSGDGRQPLENLNRELLSRAAEVNAPTFMRFAAVDLYVRTIQAGCRPLSWDDCRNLEFFRLDGATSAVLKKIARSQKNIGDYYRWIQLATQLGATNVPDPELDSMVYARSLELLRSGSKSAELRLLSDFVGSRLLMASQGSLDSLDAQALLAILHTVIHKDAGITLSKAIENGFLKLITQRLKDPVLWSEFKKVVLAAEGQGSEVGKSLVIPSSYTLAARDFKNRGSQLRALLGIEERDPSRDFDQDQLIYFYITSRLFSLEPLESVMPLWKATAQSPEAFRAISENYVRMFFGHSAMATHLKMSQGLRGIGQSGLSQSQVLTKFIESGRADVSPLWEDFFRRVGRLRAFYEREVEQRHRQSQDKPLLAKIQSGVDFYTYLPKSVKYVVTYPNLLMFAYYAKKYDYRETFEGMFGGSSITLDANIVIEDMLGGKVPPLFVFTNDTDKFEPISRFEMTYALYYALRGGLIDLYEVDAADWYQRIGDAYLTRPRDRLRSWAKSLDDLKSQGRFYKDFEQVCAVASGASAGHFPDINFVTVESIRYYTLEGRISDRSKPRMLEFLRLLQPGNPKSVDHLPEALELIRSDLNPRLRDLRLIRSLLAGSGASDSLLKSLDQTLADADQLRAFVLSAVDSLDQLARNCIFDLARLEQKRQYELYSMEREFQRHVHLAVHALNTLPGADTESVLELRARGDHPIWAEPFFSSLRPDLGLAEASRLLLDERSGLARAARVIRGYSEDLSQKGGIQRGRNGSYSYVFRRTDLFLRLLSYLETGYNQSKISFAADQPRVVYPETLGELRQKVDSFNTPHTADIRVATSGDISLVRSLEMFRFSLSREFREATADRWFFNKYDSLRYLRRWLRTGASLYKLKSQMATDPMAAAQCDSACKADKREVMRSEAVRLANLNLKVFNYLNTPATDLEQQNALKFFSEPTFFSDFTQGPAGLFTNISGGDYRYFALADETFSYVTSQHLGSKLALRSLRPQVDKEIVDTESTRVEHPSGGSMDLTQDDFVHRPDYFGEAFTAFESTLRKQTETLLFPIESEVLAGMNAYFTDFIATEMRLAETFIQVSQQEFSRVAVPPMQFHHYEESFAHPYWISPSLLGAYLEEMRIFNSKTLNQYLPEELRAERRWTPLTRP